MAAIGETPAEGARARLVYGTSSWSEPSWRGVFYPSGMHAGEWLAHYATQFPAVEADVTYYRAPTRALVRGWARRTPREFTVSAKLPKDFVHGGAGKEPDVARLLPSPSASAELRATLEAFAELGDKLGPLVLQFPYFNRRAFPDLRAFLARLEPFLAELPELASRVGLPLRVAVEVRNRAWLGAELYAALRRHRAALVLCDLAYMPHGDELDAAALTADYAYVRLIGDRAAVEALTDRFDRVVLDQGPRLGRWAELVRRLLPRTVEVHAYANNHYAGHGPATIRDLVRRIELALAPGVAAAETDASA
jgi:uncharacterized protein YecE (DUF72 family)